ncbi:YbaB/EbfC family nucleoid-associated protein [Dactylosporangium sp. NPDC005572]|uniref:YbaB/EbfC family nucleoid-associated protein n=1 Tax=Dactylosporangium sp. NPDC005572 TaxID=3156889 RepID=UPI0033B36D30
MTNPYQAVIAGAKGSTGPGEELELRRAAAAMEDLLSRITAQREAEHEGLDSTATIRAVVLGTGKLLKMEISARAIRDIPSHELGAHCMEAINAARAHIGEALRETLSDLSGGAVELGQAPRGDVLTYWREKMRELR